uniref:Uncharacterized protein n=1 Tax=Candidatus Kentrum sp. TUN TaxID=2126343 RepID=A0A451A540_9GAMM|nr:MAG: hypothetical protein BECKTUN1418F_GA0071002_106111 [Candidatus Kentron sp. TUN]VFK61148.1 MAG: hypothetical protein BECKTUN1418E_GA0071001_106211 [Candidatus Kentron sp. TUN]
MCDVGLRQENFLASKTAFYIISLSQYEILLLAIIVDDEESGITRRLTTTNFGSKDNKVATQVSPCKFLDLFDK